MKKIGIIICCILVLTGCGKQEKEQKEQLLIAARQYYESYGKTYSVDEYTVSLKQLKKAKEELKQDYDLSKVDDCKDDTSVTFTIKNKKVAKEVIKLNCNR